MNKKYPHLLSPLRMGNVVLKNRLLSTNASPHFLQGPETYPAEPYIAYAAGLAKNGAAIVTIAEWNEVPQRKLAKDLSSDMTHMQAFDLYNGGTQNYLSHMAAEVHLYGSKLIVNTRIEIPEGYSMDGGPGRPPMPGAPAPETVPLPKEMIPGVIDAFVEKMRLYKNLGYDGMAMRIDLVMVPGENPRKDEYGGSVANRTRLTLEAFAKVKEVLGADFIIEGQIAGEQPLGYNGSSKIGYTLEETIEFVKLAEGKIDILQIRESDVCKSHPTGFTAGRGENQVVRYSEAIKAAGCKIITEPIGGFQDPDYMEACIAAGKCDMFGMARAFLADFDYGVKLCEGRGEDVTPCIKCNKCHGTIKPQAPDPWITVCSVNPQLGLQSKPYRTNPELTTPKKVAIVGGGPSGMRAAIVAAERGHSVTLFEQTDYLGGQLYHAESFSFKWPIKDYRDWCVRTMKKLGVEVRMNTKAAPEMIEAEGFEAVIAATGAKAVLPQSIKGLRDETGKALYPTCIDVFGKESELGKRVIIVGGSETGVETAMYLAQNGHDVTMLTRQKEIGHDCSKLHYITMSWIKPHEGGGGHEAPAWERYENIKGIVNVTTKAVEGGKVTYTDAAGNERVVEGDSVVICGGMSPLVDEAFAFSSSADTFFMAGDCNGAGNLQRCNREAWSRALMI